MKMHDELVTCREIAWKLKGEIALVVVLRSCAWLVAQTTWYDGPCTAKRTNGAAVSFTIAPIDPSCTDKQRGPSKFRGSNHQYFAFEESPFGLERKVARVQCTYFPFFLYQSGRTSVNHCRMMRQHLSRKALGCTASQPRTRSVQLRGGYFVLVVSACLVCEI